MVSCLLLKWWIQMFLVVWHSADITRSDSCKSLRQLSPCRAGARPWWGEARLQSETKSLLCSHVGAKACAALPLHSNASDRNVQECLIWLEGEEGIKEGKRGERRLACHCIIPAAINSLCPEAEWTHHSNGPQAEWHQAALNQPSAPPRHTSRFKQAEKATGV